MRSYPVVMQKHGLGGKTWSQELERCEVFAENGMLSERFGKGGQTTLRTIMSVVDYLDRMGNIGCASAVVKCMAAADLYKVDAGISGLPGRADVELVFDIEIGRSFVCSAPDSKWYFFTSFILFPPDEATGAATVSCQLGSQLEYLLEIRSAYLTWFGKYGLRNITFFTRDGEYQQYVDQLNKKAHAE